jgi:hypothetical protein
MTVAQHFMHQAEMKKQGLIKKQCHGVTCGDKRLQS